MCNNKSTLTLKDFWKVFANKIFINKFFVVEEHNKEKGRKLFEDIKTKKAKKKKNSVNMNFMNSTYCLMF